MVKIIEQEQRRPLTTEDYRIMDIPPGLINAEIEKIPEAPRKNIVSYLEKRKIVAEKGWGLLFNGPEGGGKSSASATIAKTLCSWGYRVYFTTPGKLKEAKLANDRYNEDMSVYQQSVNVDFLIIDDITHAQLNDPIFGQHALVNLIKQRFDAARPTIGIVAANLKDIVDPEVERLLKVLLLPHIWTPLLIVGGGDRGATMRKTIFGG